MKKLKFAAVLLIALSVLTAQVGTVFAAPVLQEGFIEGTVTGLACETNVATGTVTVLVTIQGADGTSQTVRIDQATAEGLGLLTVTDGIPDCSPEALAATVALMLVVSIDPTTVITEETEKQHPVGAILSLFFSDITDYDTIMTTHDDGTGFGVIVQALWLTMRMEGDSDTFLAIIDAKKSNDFSAFVLDDGSSPQNWGQFKKAFLNGDKKANLGVVMSAHHKDKDNTNPGKSQEKVKTNYGKSQAKKKYK